MIVVFLEYGRKERNRGKRGKGQGRRHSCKVIVDAVGKSGKARSRVAGKQNSNGGAVPHSIEVAGRNPRNSATDI